MSAFIPLDLVELETNSPLWQVSGSHGEAILQVVGNTQIDHIGGKVVLIGETRQDYSMEAEMRFLGHHFPPGERAGWFGFVMRARDTENYELVWFMPRTESGVSIAYLAVAHGVVPWWTEAYATQQKGEAHIPAEDWFRARLDVLGDEFSLFVEDQPVFTKKLTYYLHEGRAGFYVGTASDASFRRVEITNIHEG